MDSKVENGSLQEDQSLGWGRSLSVPSVQEMVRLDAQCVPERYIQDNLNRPKDVDLCPISSEIPIIDFSLLSSGQEDEQRKLDLACKEWGFFQIINHGVAEEVLREVKAAVAGFFQLPLEEKKKYSMAADDIQGYGQAYVVSEQQKLDWCDLVFLLTLPPESKKLKFWPTTVQGFKEAIEQYSIEVNKIVVELLGNLSLLMDMDKCGLLKLHGEMKQGMRMNYYPTCSRPDLVLGVSPHSDCSSISVLLQEEVCGLQIRHKGGWVPVKPVPNALVVNIGDIIEAWSNGMYKSIEHRAITNEKKARISVATFVIPNDEAEVKPLDSVVDDHHRPRKYKNIKYVDYLRYTLQRKMDGKASNLQFLKLENE